MAFHQDRSIPLHDATPTDYTGWSRKEGMTFVQASDELLSSMLALRLHIDDSSEDKGPLRVIPATQLSGTLLPDRIDFVRLSCPDQNLTVDRGGVIAMRPLLLHASSKSSTTYSRRVLHFVLGPPSPSNGLQWRMAV